MPAFMAGFGALNGAALAKKGAQCSDADAGARKKKSASGRTRLSVSRQSPYGYPQNLWISVWMTGRAGAVQALQKCDASSNCSIFHQAYFCLFAQ